MVVLLLIHFSFYYIVSNSYHSSLEGECQNSCPGSEALSAVVVSSYLQPLCPSYGYSRTTTYTRTLPSIYSFDVLSPRSTRPPDRISVITVSRVAPEYHRWRQRDRHVSARRLDYDPTRHLPSRSKPCWLLQALESLSVPVTILSTIDAHRHRIQLRARITQGGGQIFAQNVTCQLAYQTARVRVPGILASILPG